MELLLTGRMITADGAVKSGLINKVFPQAELLPETIKILIKICRLAPVALAETIQSINHGIELPLEKALTYERNLFKSLFDEKDAIEGMSAFLEKRHGRFTGK